LQRSPVLLNLFDFNHHGVLSQTDILTDWRGGPGSLTTQT
jgi:hypothetical protein